MRALRSARRQRGVDDERLRRGSGGSSSAGRASCPGPGSNTAGVGATARRSRADWPVMSLPSNTMRPPLGGWMPTSALPSVDLPQPDSPTMPSVSPGRTSNDTPSSARTAPVFQPEHVAHREMARQRIDLRGSARRSCRRRLAPIGMIAAHLVPAAERRRRRTLVAAGVGRARAAGMEPASGGRADQARDLAADLAQLAARARQALEQAHGVGMAAAAGRNRRPAPSPPPGPRTSR